MARAARQRRENELPYIPFGPFQIRFPFIHYKIESVEFIQGLILGVTHWRRFLIWNNIWDCLMSWHGAV